MINKKKRKKKKMITKTDIKSGVIGLIILMLETCGSKDLKDFTLVCVKI